MAKASDNPSLRAALNLLGEVAENLAAKLPATGSTAEARALAEHDSGPACVPSRRSGIVLVLVATACFGTLGMFSKLFYDAGGDAYTLLFLRFAITGPALALLAAGAASTLFPE